MRPLCPKGRAHAIRVVPVPVPVPRALPVRVPLFVPSPGGQGGRILGVRNQIAFC